MTYTSHYGLGKSIVDWGSLNGTCCTESVEDHCNQKTILSGVRYPLSPI